MKYKALFLSDIHLGTEPCEAKKLIKFLKRIEFRELYLVGDIIDMTNMKDKFYWSKAHNKVLKYFLKLAKDKSIKIYYIIGNHDIHFSSIIGNSIGRIKMVERLEYTCVDKKYLILHGHQFDGVIKNMTWLYNFGNWSYDVALKFSKLFNVIRKVFGLQEWSLANYLKHRVKNVVKFVNNYENLVIQEAKQAKCDGIICGHIHIAGDKLIDNVHYLNTGCWTDPVCSYIVDTGEKLELKYLA